MAELRFQVERLTSEPAFFTPVWVSKLGTATRTGMGYTLITHKVRARVILEVGSGEFTTGEDIRGRSHGRSIMSEYMKRRPSGSLCLIQNDFHRRWAFRRDLEQKKKDSLLRREPKKMIVFGRWLKRKVLLRGT